MQLGKDSNAALVIHSKHQIEFTCSIKSKGSIESKTCQLQAKWRVGFCLQASNAEVLVSPLRFFFIFVQIKLFFKKRCYMARKIVQRVHFALYTADPGSIQVPHFVSPPPHPQQLW